MLFRRTTPAYLLLLLLVVACAAVAIQAFIPPATTFAQPKGLALSQRAASSRTRSSTALQMNLADRFFRVVKANINSVLQNLVRA